MNREDAKDAKEEPRLLPQWGKEKVYLLPFFLRALRAFAV